MKRATFVLIISLISHAVSAQQWVESGNEIYNNNTGIVIIKSRPGAIGTTRLAIVPAPTEPGTTVIIGEPNTGSGGYTSMSLSISEYQNGYSSIQSIKSAGSAWGVLSLNPSGGGVGIGTTAPGSFKLAVEGKIGAREIKVTPEANWPDYVFLAGYERMTLGCLEAYIDKNKHLPHMPSSEEVKRNGGIELGELNIKLLEKIEELTLYVIDLNKEIETLKKENDKLKNIVLK